ncbi:hypothetical protein [Methanotorris formicicus]|uniref:Uncharacterized protein n=1 Tax=Methanotorris formicicus Mc-S-70 TaxID=647171 RepID=H1KYD0_9EURY|nr:hypothetical protein [Methanotorris formicicus]EHP87214.1 hypothetical protein MetfoDRAFT_0803 [Methanotorris formicicus Mc-S-70]
MLTALNSILTNSINSLGFNCSEGLSKFAQVKTSILIKYYSIYTTIKPLSKKSTDIFIEIIRFLFHIDIGTVVGDTFVTTKKIMKKSKELGMGYIGKLRRQRIL